MLIIISALFSSYAHAQSQFSDIPKVGLDGTVEMSFDPDNANDTEFLKNLLLSHGLKLNSDHQGALGTEAYSQLIESVGESSWRDDNLLVDVRDQFVLSQWTELRVNNEQEPAEQDTSATDFRTIWWRVNAPQPVSDNSIPIVATKPLTVDQPERISLANSGNRATDTLTNQLQDAGYELDFADECQFYTNQSKLINEWLERGNVENTNTPLKRAPELRLDAFQSGVSVEWRVIWLDCPDGEITVRLPPEMHEALPIDNDSQALFQTIESLLPEIPDDVSDSVDSTLIDSSINASNSSDNDANVESEISSNLGTPSGTEASADIDVPINTEASVEIDAPLGTEASAKTDAQVSTEAGAEIDAPVSTEASVEIDAPLGTESSAETDAQVRTEISTEIDAPLGTEASAEIDVPLATESSAEKDTQVRTEVSTEIDAQVSTETTAGTDASVSTEASAETDAQISTEASAETDVSISTEASAEINAPVSTEEASAEIDAPLGTDASIEINGPISAETKAKTDAPLGTRASTELDTQVSADVGVGAEPAIAHIGAATATIASEIGLETASENTPEPQSAPSIGFSPPGDGFDSDHPFESTEIADSVDNAAKTRIQLNDDVPPGFESLAGPQFVFVDIYFNEEKIGSTGVIASSEDVTFDNPIEVAQWMSETVETEELAIWLSQPLPSNGHLACYAENDPQGCGQINGDPIALIYNEVLLRIDLFVSREYQSIDYLEGARYLPNPDRRNTAVFSVNAQASKFDEEESRIDLSGRALLSYGRGHFTAEADYIDARNESNLRELTLTHNLDNYEVTAGTYGYNVGGGLPDIELLGAGFGTSFKTRLDLDNAFSSQLVVYLATRSVVQLVIADRIHTGDSYPAGNQVLDTSALPDGTYEVEIRIIDTASNTRTERRIFTKSTQIPPDGEPVINVTAGTVLDLENTSALPVTSDVNVAGVSYTRRLTDQSAYRFGLLQFGSQSFAQAEFIYLGSKLSYQLTASAGEVGTVAAGLQAGFGIKDFSFNISGSYYETDFQAIPESVESAFYLSDFSQLSLSASRVFEKFTLGSRVSERRETSDEGEITVSREFSLFAQKPLFRGAGKRGFIGTRFQHTEEEQRAEITLDIHFNRGRSLSGSIESSLIDSNLSDDFWEVDASVGWTSRPSANGQLKSNAYLGVRENQSSNGLRVELDHPWFRATAATDQSINNEQDESSRNSVASVSAHFGVDSSGAGIGGSDFARSGVIVDVIGEPGGAQFDVMIDNVVAATGKIGQEQFIGLQPFREYELKLIPKTLLGNGIGEDIHQFTLFPGGVQRVSVKARRQILVIATVIDENGELVIDALARSEENTTIIGIDSILQAEVFEGEPISVRLADGRTCTVTVPEYSGDDVLVVDEPLVCEPVQ